MLSSNERSVDSLKVSLEMIANLIYLSRRTDTHCTQQHEYLDRAAKVIADLRHHPTLREHQIPLSEMSCEEKSRLAMQYKAATLAFSEAVQEMNMKIGTSSKAEYERLERISRAAWVKSEQARLILEQHIAAHRC